MNVWCYRMGNNESWYILKPDGKVGMWIPKWLGKMVYAIKHRYSPF